MARNDNGPATSSATTASVSVQSTARVAKPIDAWLRSSGTWALGNKRRGTLIVRIKNDGAIDGGNRYLFQFAQSRTSLERLGGKWRFKMKDGAAVDLVSAVSTFSTNAANGHVTIGVFGDLDQGRLIMMCGRAARS